MQVTANISKGDHSGKAVTVEYAPLDSADLKTLVENFGETEVFEHAKRSFIVGLQSFLRNQIEAGKTDEGIQEAANEWKPGVRRAAKSPQERIAEMMAKLSPAERSAMLQQYGVAE